MTIIYRYLQNSCLYTIANIISPKTGQNERTILYLDSITNRGPTNLLARRITKSQHRVVRWLTRAHEKCLAPVWNGLVLLLCLLQPWANSLVIKLHDSSRIRGTVWITTGERLLTIHWERLPKFWVLASIKGRQANETIHNPRDWWKIYSRMARPWATLSRWSW